MPKTRTRTSIIAGTVAAAALAGGIAAAAQPASAAPAAHQSASRCVYFAHPRANGVSLRTAPSTRANAGVKYAYEGHEYTLDGCDVTVGSGYAAPGGKWNDMWIRVKHDGRWYWSAVAWWEN